MWRQDQLHPSQHLSFRRIYVLLLLYGGSGDEQDGTWRKPEAASFVFVAVRFFVALVSQAQRGLGTHITHLG
jgi:hypothetical protein